MMADPRPGLAVIGTGMAARPHALALKQLDARIRVTGVFSRTPEKREAFAGQYGFKTFDSPEAIAADPATKAVLVITPPNQRKALVDLFADAGKHILMEKPVERTTAAALELVETCERAGVKLGIVLQHRFRAASQALAALIADGAPGALHTVHATVPWWREQAYYDEPGRGTHARDGGGVLISQAIHTLDLMLSLTGPVASVQAMAGTSGYHRMESEDFVAGGMHFANGALGSVMATTAAYPGEAEALVFGFEKAAARLQSGTLKVHWRDGRTEQSGEAATTGGGADPMAFPSDWHRDLIADFMDAVETGREPAVTGRAALAVHRLIDALIASSRLGRQMAVEQDP